MLLLRETTITNMVPDYTYYGRYTHFGYQLYRKPIGGLLQYTYSERWETCYNPTTVKQIVDGGFILLTEEKARLVFRLLAWPRTYDFSSSTTGVFIPRGNPVSPE